MKKLIVTIGASNSGKSTFAHQMFLENPATTVVVNRDKIRELLFGYSEDSISEYYKRDDVGSFEKEITKYEDTLIHEGLNLNKTVIVDATHLDVKYLERYKFWNVPVKLKWFDVTPKEAIERNSKRTRKVGEDIIIKQINRYASLKTKLEKNPIDFSIVRYTQDITKIPAIIFDIDGTLAHKGDRSPYDWMQVGKDTLDNAVGILNIALDRLDGVKVIICTGRDAVCVDETEKWLLSNHIEWDKLYIRDRADQRPDWVVKEEMWVKIMENHNIITMIDDRNQVVRRARALGFKVLQVDYGNF